MKKTLLSSSLFTGLLLLPSLSQAEDIDTPNTDSETTEAPADTAWSGNAELGFIQTSGNSDTQSFNGKFNLERQLEPVTTSLNLEVLTSEEDGDSSKERYNAEIEHDYSLGERSYVASVLAYEDDRFNGYQYQSSLSVGYGYHAWADEQGELDLEVGPGYRRSALEERNEGGNKIEEEAIARASLNLLVNIGESAKFTEKFTVEGGDSKIVYKSDMGIQSTLIGQLAMKINYQVKHTTEVPEDKKKTDSLVGVTLVYSF
ncbi:MAG: putative salt-induced outer membrane protein [Oleispira sp.]|jgi:putative salt-induced outer membrane protein